MNDKKVCLQIGLVDFAEPTLLLLGDATSFSWLADCIKARQSLDFAELPFVELVNVKLKLEVAHVGDLIQRAATFDWRVSLDESQQFSDQLRMLATSKAPAHAYLDPVSNSSGVQIVASLGEYSAANVFNP